MLYFTMNSFELSCWTVVVVKWLACLPYTPTIWVKLLLKSSVILFKLLLKRTKMNKRDQWFAHSWSKNNLSEGKISDPKRTYIGVAMVSNVVSWQTGREFKSHWIPSFSTVTTAYCLTYYCSGLTRETKQM